MSNSPHAPRWYQDAVIYQLHIKAFADSNGDGIGDFRGLTSRLDYLQELGITAIWLLPFYPSPLKDDGYDTADYRRVHPSYGDIEQFRAFMAEAKARGLRVITELVLNHTSDQHEWFQRARRAPIGHPDRDFYVWSDTADRYPDVRIIFKDFETSNWTWDPVAGQYYWHRFYSHQPDLNWENPTVVQELYDIVDFWLDMGVDGLRLDAVPYLFEEDGTNGENLPQTHQALKDLRTHVDARHGGDKMLLAEANMWPDEVVDYFGDGDECHMAFHFPLMPRLYMAARMEDRFPIIDILDETPDIPEGAQWAIFLRNHDELTLEMVTDEERDYMWRIYAEDERARINLGIRRRLAPLLGNSRRQIELMNSLLFSLPGTPVVYYGDEIGMGDNIYLGDRDGVRTPMQWSPDRNAGFSSANPQRLYLPVVADPEYDAATVNVESQHANYESLLWWTRRMIATRKRHPALGHGKLEWVASENNKVLSYLRVADDERILCVVNLSRHAQHVELDLSEHVGARPISLPGHSEFPVVTDAPYGISLGPHDYFWFVLEPARPDDATLVEAGALPQVAVEARWDEVLVGRHQGKLEAALPSYLRERRWFRSKARRIRSAQVIETIPVDVPHAEDGIAYVAIVEVDYSTGEPERYVLPLIAEPADVVGDDATTADVASLLVVDLPDGRRLSVHDALANAEFSTALAAAVFGERELRGRAGGMVGVTTDMVDAVRSNGTTELPVAHVAGQHSNSTIEFGDRFVLKLYRMLEDGGSPDVELGRFLTEQTNCELAPIIGGTLEYRNSDGEGLFAERASTIASVQERIDHRGDAWTVTLDDVRRFGEVALAQPDVPELPDALVYRRARLEPTAQAIELIGPYLETARLLGVRTADLHAALASAPEGSPLAPEPVTPMYRRSLFQSMRGSAKRTFESLRRLQDERPALTPLLEVEPVVLDRLRSLLDVGLDERRIRGHGDFHLGQVLMTGRDLRIIDFEGEPLRPVGERRIKRSALKDVASMVRSFDYAASTVLDELRGHGDTAEDTPARERLRIWLEFWYRWVSATFVRSYLESAQPHGFLPTSETDLETMLDAMLLEKALYELVYEANSRPEWMWIPMRSVHRRIRGDEVSAG